MNLKKGKIQMVTIWIIMLMIFAFSLISCSAKSDKGEQKLDIDVNDIVKITVKTQMTDTPPEETEISESDWAALADKLNAIELAEKIGMDKQETKHGWQYLFAIESKDQSMLHISFLEDEATMNGISYKISNYHPDDFLYLFEK